MNHQGAPLLTQQRDHPPTHHNTLCVIGLSGGDDISAQYNKLDLKLNDYATIEQCTQVDRCSQHRGRHLNGSVKEPNKLNIYETEKITRKASDVQNISSCSVLSPEIVMHDAFNVIL